MVDFYRERSSPLLHCAIVGNVVVPDGYGTNAVTPRISSDFSWRTLALAIRAQGSMPGIQLATAWSGYEGVRSFRPKEWAHTIEHSRKIAAAVTPSHLQKLFKSLRLGTEMAADAGFEHVQLHAAHGYLFSLLLDSRLYEGAGDFAHFVALWNEWCLSLGLETSVRFSLKTGDPNFDGEGTLALQDTISALPVRFVDVSSGYYNVDKRLIYPSITPIISDRHVETLALALRNPGVAFILSGRASLVTKPLPQNVHLGFCRDLLANPNFLEMPSHGCVNSGKCHYHSRGTSHVLCSQWLRS